MAVHGPSKVGVVFRANEAREETVHLVIGNGLIPRAGQRKEAEGQRPRLDINIVKTITSGMKMVIAPRYLATVGRCQAVVDAGAAAMFMLPAITAQCPFLPKQRNAE